VSRVYFVGKKSRQLVAREHTAATAAAAAAAAWGCTSSVSATRVTSRFASLAIILFAA